MFPYVLCNRAQTIVSVIFFITQHYEFEIYLRHTYLAYSFSQLYDYVVFEFIIAATATVVTTFCYNSPWAYVLVFLSEGEPLNRTAGV